MATIQRHLDVGDMHQQHDEQHELGHDELQHPLSLSQFMNGAIEGGALAVDIDDDEALESILTEVYALEVFREEVRRAEQLQLDEAVAISLYDEEVKVLLRHSGNNNDDNDIVVVNANDLEGKPPPSCACCLLELADAATRRALPCGHLYCLACITTRAGMGVRDRALLPAHCCRQEFPIEYVAEALSRADFERYEAYLKDKHWTTLDLDSDREYARVAQQNGCVQCPGCGVAVSRISGCNRMRCCNGHEFCFACGLRWKTCQCPYP